MSIHADSSDLKTPELPVTVTNMQQQQTLSTSFSLQTWLELQTSLIDGAFAGLLTIKSPDGRLEPKALCESQDVDIDLLAEITERGLEQGEGLVVELESPSLAGSQRYALAYPVVTFSESETETEIFAVVTLALEAVSADKLSVAMQQLQWGCSWLQLSSLYSRQLQVGVTQARLGDSVSLLANVLAQPNFDTAAMRLLSDLVSKLDCEMVSLGYRKKGLVEVCHLSHSAQFGKKMNWVRAIGKAMDEALDQQMTICYAAGGGTKSSGLVTVAHAALALQQQEENILTLPIFIRQPSGLIDAVGALTLERDIDAPFTEADVEYCESIIALAGSALEDKRENAKSIAVKVFDVIRDQREKFLGPDFWGRKLLACTCVLLILFFTFAEGEYWLSSDGAVEASFQRVLAAPYDGYIDNASVRAGDLVKKGDLVFSLDDRDLQLERLRWRSQKTKLSRQYQEATANHDRAQTNIIAAQLAQAKAQLKLVESKLERADQFAPFDGLIVSGDLSQRLGGGVAKGDQLFELSPLGQYRVELLVRESRIADIQLQQQGRVYLSALPDDPFDIEVTKITPLTRSKDGASYFSVEAKIADSNEFLRPGMEGVGKLYIDERNLMGIWTRELSEWLRLILWRWWS